MSFRSALHAEPVLATQIIITRKRARRKIAVAAWGMGPKIPEIPGRRGGLGSRKRSVFSACSEDSPCDGGHNRAGFGGILAGVPGWQCVSKWASWWDRTLWCGGGRFEIAGCSWIRNPVPQRNRVPFRPSRRSRAMGPAGLLDGPDGGVGECALACSGQGRTRRCRSGTAVGVDSAKGCGRGKILGTEPALPNRGNLGWHTRGRHAFCPIRRPSLAGQSPRAEPGR